MADVYATYLACTEIGDRVVQTVEDMGKLDNTPINYTSGDNKLLLSELNHARYRAGDCAASVIDWQWYAREAHNQVWR
jgi:hypothetical protein